MTTRLIFDPSNGYNLRHAAGPVTLVARVAACACHRKRSAFLVRPQGSDRTVVAFGDELFVETTS